MKFRLKPLAASAALIFIPTVSSAITWSQLSSQVSSAPAGSTVQLNAPVTYDFGNTIYLAKDLVIESATAGVPQTINGNGNFYLFQNNGVGTTLTLNDLVLNNGAAGVGLSNNTLAGNNLTFSNFSSGALSTQADSIVNITGQVQFNDNNTIYQSSAISNQGTITFEDASFARNQSSQSVVVNYGGSITMGNAVFSENNGIGILNGASVHITNDATFSNNTNSAIQQTFAGYHAELTISGHAAFSGNSASSGSSIYNGSGQTVTLNSAEFLNNYTTGLGQFFDGLGGAVFNNGTFTILQDTSFVGNHASALKGGAVYNNGSFEVLGTATFTDNYVSGVNTGFNTQGGALYNGAHALFNDASFVNNTVVGSGGAIYNDQAADLTIRNATFQGNTANQGGAIYNTGTIDITGTALFEQNTASGNGNAIYNQGNLTFHDDATFTNNTTLNFGYGTVFNGNLGHIIMEKATFTDNKVYYGGGITNSGTFDINGDAVFTNNEAGYSSGAISAQNGVLNIQGKSTFTGNHALTSGAISTFSNAIVNLKNAEFIDNYSTGSDSGAIRNAGKVTIDGNALFSGNQVRGGGGGGTGGAVYNEQASSVFTITGTADFSNNAILNGGSGGAIYNNTGTVSLQDAIFSHNSVSVDGNGGAIYTAGGTFSLGNVSFIENSAGGSGGAMSIGMSSVNIAGDAVFQRNTAAYGGALSIFGGPSNTLNIMGHALFEQNSAEYGGAINSSGFLHLQSATFDGNTASDSGGALYNLFDNFSADFIELENNIANNQGGAINNIAGSVTLNINTDQAFTGNVAKGGGAGPNAAAGGFLYTDGGSVTLNIAGNSTLMIGNDGVLDGTDSIAGNEYATLNKTGVGTLLLNSDSSGFEGTTSVENGRMIVGLNSGVSLGGSIINDALVAGAGTIGESFTNNNTLAALNSLSDYSGRAAENFNVGALVNNGTIQLAGSYVGNTLTVTNNYTGNDGALVLNTVLEADSSLTDRLIIGANSSGNTKVYVNNVGGQGAKTTADGIEVISVAGTSDGDFKLGQRVLAGLYEYDIYKGGVDGNAANGNWYLRSLEQAVTPAINPESTVYLRNLSAASSMFMHSLHDRLGEPQFADAYKTNDSNPSSAWVRVVNNHTDSTGGNGQVDLNTDTNLVHLGTDIIRWSSNGTDRWNIGVMGAYGQSEIDASAKSFAVTPSGYKRNATGKVDGYSVGGYVTWYQNKDKPEGIYVDAWTQFGWYDNKVQGNTQSEESYNSSGWTASVEAGYAMIAREEGNGRQLMFEPQIQVAYNRYSSDDHTDINGTRITDNNANGVITRVGARLYSRSTLNDNGVQPFVEANWWYSDAKNSLAFNGETMSDGTPNSRYELKAGLQGEIAKNWLMWGHAGVQFGQNDFNRYEGMVGIKRMF